MLHYWTKTKTKQNKKIHIVFTLKVFISVMKRSGQKIIQKNKENLTPLLFLSKSKTFSVLFTNYNAKQYDKELQSDSQAIIVSKIYMMHYNYCELVFHKHILIIMYDILHRIPVSKLNSFAFSFPVAMETIKISPSLSFKVEKIQDSVIVFKHYFHS